MKRRLRTKHQEANQQHAEYRAWTAQQPCCNCGAYAVQLAHVGQGGMGLKHGDDDQVVPMCPACHFDHDNTRGNFARPVDIGKYQHREAMRTWDTVQVALHRGRFEGRNVIKLAVPF